MGAQDFRVDAKGATAREAFNAAVEQAQWEHGHGGYTGTIAEKDSFKLYPLKEGQTAEELIASFQKDWTGPYSDKWGPAGCVNAGDGEWIFFGSASS